MLGVLVSQINDLFPFFPWRRGEGLVTIWISANAGVSQGTSVSRARTRISQMHEL